jgi:hypothetical protein
MKSDDEIGRKLQFGISHYDFEVLKLFARSDVDLKNSNIADVTNILETVIMRKDSFKPNNKLLRYMKNNSRLMVKILKLNLIVFINFFLIDNYYYSYYFPKPHFFL